MRWQIMGDRIAQNIICNPERELIGVVKKPINYDLWVINWKKQLESLSAAEAKELDALEKENLKTINEKDIRGGVEIKKDNLEDIKYEL